jgi:sulfate adenylyltransferase
MKELNSSVTRTSTLIAPYGGKLVDLMVPAESFDELKAYASKLPSLQISPRSVCDLELLVAGAFSPLDRFMSHEDFQRVLNEMRLADGHIFPVPITLPTETSPDLRLGRDIALRNSEYELLAIMTIDEMYEWDRAEVSRKIYGTQDMCHPLVAELQSWGPVNISGRIQMLNMTRHSDFKDLRLKPAQTRAKLEEIGRRNVVACQAHGLLNQAHEELTTRIIKEVDGTLLLHPIVGSTKLGDLDHFIRVRSYKALADGYYDPEQVLLSLLPLATHMAGPREILWQALIRRNYGANHMIMSHNHNGYASSSESMTFYDSNGAHELVEKYSQQLGVKMLPEQERFENVSSILEVPPTASISNTKITAQSANNGQTLPSWYHRHEADDILAETYPPRHRQGVCIWFTGLSGSGKSATAEMLTWLLLEHNRRVTVLDGDVVRTHLSKGLSFCKKDRDTNVRRIGFVASELVRLGGVVICAVVSPYRAARNDVRNMVVKGQFLAVFVDTPLSVCEARDVKGIYAKARRGELKGLTGIDDPYEPPHSPEITLDTVNCTLQENASFIVDHLIEQGFIRIMRKQNQHTSNPIGTEFTMNKKNTKVIVTLGPATNTEQDLRKIKDKGVDFVRVNMSHSSLEDLEHSINLSKKVGIPFIIDTEGSQIRTGHLEREVIYLNENDKVKICAEEIAGNTQKLSLTPGYIIKQLEEGDLIHIDFDTLILRVVDVSTVSKGYILARAISGGFIGRNKAVVVDPVFKKKFQLPPLSPKDYQSIELGLKEGIDHIAVSFVRSGASIDEVRRATQNKMKIISKVECVDALENIDEIVQKSDFILIDRGDLSKEIPIEKIPFTQKIIMQKARRYKTGVFVATNLLETMVEKKKPTRAEVHDVVNTIVDGTLGLTLSAETAIGKYPMECINMLNKLIQHAELMLNGSEPKSRENGFIRNLESSPYLLENVSSSLIPPHGGKLVNRVQAKLPDSSYLDSLPKIRLDQNKQMDVEQITIGTYSPLEGFMGQEDFQSVLTSMRLANGIVWPLPIILDVAEERADKLSIGDTVGLTDDRGEVMALLHLSEKFHFDREDTANKLYGTNCGDHPGVRMIRAMQPVLLAGQVDLIRGRESDTRAYELTPKQLRRLFEERGWAKILGFHTRNVVHRGHEFMQLKAMEDENCDGLLVQPVVGKKKPGDFKPEYIIKSYEKMIESFYPKEKVVFAVFSTFSRYAGPREALFTALCRKNFGCSHFIIGRDHTGVGDYYDPYASHRIFDNFPDLGIKIVKFNEIFYTKKLNKFVEGNGKFPYDGSDKLSIISGSQARTIFLSGERPPGWFMRPDISNIVLDAVKNGEHVFEKKEV